MTHPFHPLHGEQFLLLDQRSEWGQDRVLLQKPDGKVLRLLAEWTDAVPPDPYVTLGRGRARLRVPDLLRLVEILAASEGRVAR